MNLKAAGVYVWLAGLSYVALLVYVALRYRPEFALVAALAPVAVFVALVPRLALLQFVFFLLIVARPVSSVPVTVMDLSSLLLISAAIIDILGSGQLPRRLPRLSGNYLILIGALLISAVSGYNLVLSFRPILRIVFLLFTFWSVYRLSRHVSVAFLLKSFVGIVAAHATVNVLNFVRTGGSIRQFGLADVTFDDIAMVALPLAIALYMFSKSRNWLYALASLVIFGGLVATQSRAPIVLGLLIVVIMLLIGYRSLKSVTGSEQLQSYQRRYALLFVGTLVLAIGIAAAKPELFSDVLNRFDTLFQERAQGSTVYRLVLWKTALMAFADNPLTGLGPGMFPHMADIYSNLRTVPMYYYVRGMTAHNITLHYLAETGLLGTSALLLLVVNHLRLSIRVWKRTRLGDHGLSLALFGWGLLFLLTTLIEGSWMWGQMSFLGVFLAALLSRQFQVTHKHGDH